MAIIRPIEEAHASNWARRCQRNDTVLRGTMGEATRHQSGSCPRIAQRSWAFRRRGPADPAVLPALHLVALAVRTTPFHTVLRSFCYSTLHPPPSRRRLGTTAWL